MRASHLLFFVIAFALFLLLSGSVDGAHLVAGVFVAAMASILFGGGLSVHPRRVLDPRRWGYFVVWVGVFLWECIKANFDVAYRVLHPTLPIHPGIVRIDTQLENPTARALLANAVTMTPGTLSVDLVGDTLYVHWINVTTRDRAEATEKVAGRFERLLGKIFE